MTALVDIGNRALQIVGTRTTMTQAEFTGQTSNEAIQLNLIMTSSRRALLRMAPWSFAKKTANLVYITSAPGTPENTSAATTLWQPGQPAPPWAYEYQYPVDCVRACWLIPASQTGYSSGLPTSGAVTGGAAGFWQGPPVKFQIQTDTFYTINAATVLVGGTGYAVGDIITLATTPSGSAPIGAPAQLQVTGVSSGAITSVSVISILGGATSSSTGQVETLGGSYFTIQSSPIYQSATTGSGTSALFNVTWNTTAAPQRVVLTNQEFATMVYIQDVIDPNLMDDQFQEAYAQVAAARVIMTLTGDKKLANMCINETNRMIEMARVGDGNEGLTNNDVTPDWLRTRGIDFGESYSGPFSGMDWGGMWPVF